MKTPSLMLAWLVIGALMIAPTVSATTGLRASARGLGVFAEEESADVDAPSEAVIRKLAAMMPDQTFKRGDKQTSKGGAAPEGTTIYPVKILNPDGTLAFDANFFKEASGKWALFDNFGNVARMPD